MSLCHKASCPTVLWILNLSYFKKWLEENKKEISNKTTKQKDALSVSEGNPDFQIVVDCKNPEKVLPYTC